jgi:hypothetical protein
MATAAQENATIIKLADGTYATARNGQWVPYTGPLPNNTPGAQQDQGFKVGDTDAITHAWDVLDSINSARSLSHKPLAAGTRAEAVRNIPLVGGMVGQNRDNLQTKLGSIAGDLRQLAIHNLYQQTGSKGVGSIARSTSEQQALQSSLAPLGFVEQGGHASPTGAAPDAATLGQGLDVAQNIYLRHLARLYGASPDDPNVLATLGTAVNDPKQRSTLLQALQNPGAAKALSSTDQAVLNPAVDKIKGQLTNMLNAPQGKVSNQQILDFVKQNNVDPEAWPDLQAALKRRGKVQFNVDPHFNQKLTGVPKVMSQVGTFAPGGVPIGASVVGFGDAFTGGAAPDIAGIVHGVTGLGPTRADVVTARDMSAEQNPIATFLGNAGGIVANPLMRGGGLGRTAALSGLYGGLSSSDPSVGARALNATIGASVGGLAHGATSAVAKGGQNAFRALRSIMAPVFGDSGAPDANALARVADALPKQDVAAIRAAVADGRTPAAVALSPAGQAFMQKVAGSSPGARTAAQAADKTLRQAIPAHLANDFNSAISDLAPNVQGAQTYLNRPVREVAKDVQDMAGREFETGIEPIKNDQIAVDQELADAFGHEQMKPAIADTLRNSKLSPESQAVLRSLPQWLKEGMLGKLPITVDVMRNLATTLDRRALNSHGDIVMRDLAQTLRGKIVDQFPEYKPVNDLYASRKRAIDAMEGARSHFLGDTPESMDALHAATQNLSDAPNPPEFKGVMAAEPSGPVLPSNRQFAAAGAREAATTKAGSGANQNGADVLRRIAEGGNQQSNNQMVLGNQAADLAARAGKSASTAEAVANIAKGPAGDQTGNWFKYAKYALMTKATGGAAHYAVAKSLAGMPKLTADDAARVTHIFLNADSADQALKALTRSYGASTARNILGRVAGIGAAGQETRSQP